MPFQFGKTRGHNSVQRDRKSTRLNSSHSQISYAVFCLKKKNLAAPAGLLAATLLAILYGASVRTRSVYFILITIALDYIILSAVYRCACFTTGANCITN